MDVIDQLSVVIYNLWNVRGLGSGYLISTVTSPTIVTAPLDFHYRYSKLKFLSSCSIVCYTLIMMSIYDMHLKPKCRL